MNQERCAGIWKQCKGEFKVRWGMLSDNPELIADGVCDGLAGRIQARLALSRERADWQLSEFLCRKRDGGLPNRGSPQPGRALPGRNAGW